MCYNLGDTPDPDWGDPLPTPPDPEDPVYNVSYITDLLLRYE